MSNDNVDWTATVSGPSWTPQVNDWPSVDLAQIESFLDPGAMSTASFIPTENNQNHIGPTAPLDWLTHQYNATAPSPPAQVLDASTSRLSAPPLFARTIDTPSDMTDGVRHPSLDIAKTIQILRKYPTLLSSDDYHTPLLHPITCALALQDSRNASFVKRTMTAECQHLVDQFSRYSCIEEWDSLYAMWMYEMMELSGAEENVNDHWRPVVRAKGLTLPILLKMTRRFCQSHPEASDPSAPMTRNVMMRYAPAPSAWLTWSVGETSRRMVFLAHIVNYFSTKDAKTGQTSLSYEPLDDEMIWNMPLPCSQAAWNAQTEQDWLGVLQTQDLNFVTESRSVLLSEVFKHEPTIKILMAKFTKDQIRSRYAGEMGFQDTESFRNLVVHCALELLAYEM